MGNTSDLDSGFLWRIRGVDSGRYLRANRATGVFASAAFFSVFEVQPHHADGGRLSALIREHWSSRLLQAGSPSHMKRLGLTPLPKPRRRYLHWHVNHPPMPAFPPPPPPPPVAIQPKQLFRIKRRHEHGFELFIDYGDKRRSGCVRDAGKYFTVSTLEQTGLQAAHNGCSLFTLERVVALKSSESQINQAPLN